MNSKLGISLLIGIAVSAVSFYIAFRNVPLAQLVSSLGEFQYRWVWPSAFTVVAAMAIRVLRWRMILGARRNVGFWSAFHPMVIGFFINCILPGRLGEVARPLILRQNSQVPFSEGLATVVLERFLDMVILILLLMATLAMVDIDPGLEIPVAGYLLNRETLVRLAKGMGVMGVGLLTGFCLLIVGASRRWIIRWVMAAPRYLIFFPPALARLVEERVSRPLSGMIEKFAAGLSSLLSPSRFAGCFGLSVLLWLATVYSYHVLARGIPGVSVTFLEMTVVMVIVCFFIALPSVPGYWGLWEAAGVFGLSLFGIPVDIASAYTLVSHAVQLFPLILMGGISLIITGVKIRNVISERGAKTAMGGQASG